MDWFWAGFAGSLLTLALLLFERAMTRERGEDRAMAAVRRGLLHPKRDHSAPRTELERLIRRQLP